MEVCGDPTRLHKEENAQCNGTGPPNQIQLIHGERLHEDIGHTAFANSCMGGTRLTRFVGV